MNKVKEFRTIIVGTLLIISGVYGATKYAELIDKKFEKRKEVVCPSFLSIARSARDTLIVMRNEPLCNAYVLDNLQ